MTYVTCNRRSFLKGSAAVALGLGMGTTAGSLSHAATPTSWKQAFDQALTQDARLLGWKSVDKPQMRSEPVQWQGRLPEGLVGRLYRNGPALHDRFGQRYHHWFDGDGMVQAYSLGQEGLAHQGRVMETPKYLAEEQAERLLYPGFGTDIDGGAAVRRPDDVNAANTSILAHNGEIMALWEAGSATLFDGETLKSQGFKAWQKDLAGLPFSAHPKVEPDGTLWNFGYFMGRKSNLVLYHISPAGEVIKTGLLTFDQLGFVHDFAVTERHLIFVLPPFNYDAELSAQGRSFLDSHRWQGDLPTRILMVDKNDFSKQRWAELPANFFFHFGNAWEDADGTLHFDYCPSQTADFVTGLLRDVMKGGIDTRGDIPQLTAVTVYPDGRVSSQVLASPVEFTRVDPGVVGRRHRWLYGLTGSDHPDQWPFSAVAAWDLETQRMQRFDYGPQVIAEEHVFVADPAARQEGDGWLVGSHLDVAKGVTGLAVFDARRVEEGPLAQAQLPYALPLGFHGQWVPG
ncbi:carotenoid oxygenase family protein [Rhodovibrionaceae bacterium A322]